MKYNETPPCNALKDNIHSFWELKGEEKDGQWERIFPDGCPGLVINLGDACKTDSGLVTMKNGKTYIVGAMTSFKDNFIDSNTHLLGVCMKPATINLFFNYLEQSEIINQTVQLDKKLSFDFYKLIKNPISYLNRFFLDRMNRNFHPLHHVLNDIEKSMGRESIYDVSKRNGFSVRQLQRHFKHYIGLSPKEYSNIIRFQNAMKAIKQTDENRSFLDIAFEYGYYDHSHFSNEIKRNTGHSPSQIF